MYLFTLAELGFHCFLGFFLVEASGDHCLVWACRLLIVVTSHVEHGLWSPAQQLWCFGLVTHVGSSGTRDQTRVSCIGRWILYH